MPDESEGVEYVNGHAESQQEDGESALPSDDREAAIEAVRKAVAEEGKKAAAEAKEADEKDQYKPKGLKPEKDPETGKFVSKEPKKDEAPVDEDTNELKKVLKNRERVAKDKAKASEDFNRQRGELAQREQQLRQYEAKLRQDAEKMARLRRDPVAAVRDVGWDPDEFITSLAREGTPEGKLERQIRELTEKSASIDAWKAEQLQAQLRAQADWQQQQMAQQRVGIEQKFTGQMMDEEKHPIASSLFKGSEGVLIAWGDQVAAQYRDLTGEEATLEDIAEYIEDELAKSTEAWYTKRVGGGKTGATSKRDVGLPPKAAKGKTLTQSSVSERRSLGKELQDLDGEERRSAAMDAVRAAIAESGSDDDR